MAKSKEEILERINEIGVSRRVCLSGVCPKSRDAPMQNSINEDERKISFTLVSKDNAGERYDWWNDEVYIEELDINGANLEPLQTFFTDHRPSVDNAIGRVENKRIEDGEIKADVIFGTSQRADEVFTKYKDAILTDVSIGYKVNDLVVTEKKGEPAHVLITDYDIVELSAVWKGFDTGAKADREQKTEQKQIKRASAEVLKLMKRKLKLLQGD